MCCSRDHYPPDVGVWHSDAEANHYHDGDTIYEKGYDDDGNREPHAPVTESNECDGPLDHIHTVLPRLVSMGGGVCMAPERLRVRGAWTDFSKFKASSTDLKPQRSEATAVLDPGKTARSDAAIMDVSTRLATLLTLAAVEGGRFSFAIMRDIAKEFADHEGILVEAYETAHTSYITPGFVLGYVPEDVPEYHEWLVMQAQLELQRRNGGVLVA